MTQIKDGVASFKKGQANVQFKKTLTYDASINAYGLKETQFKVKNMRTNQFIGEVEFNLADYVDVLDLELTMILENSTICEEKSNEGDDEQYEGASGARLTAQFSAGMREESKH